MEACGCILTKVEPVGFQDEKNFVRQAKEFGLRDPNGIFTDQFNNPYNKKGHFEETAREIEEQMEGKIDLFVMGAGTGASINGISQYLKSKHKLAVVLADPTGSSLFNWVRSGTLFTPEEKEGHKKRKIHRTVVEGIGLNWLCSNTEDAVIDDAEHVTDHEAFAMAKYMLKHEGLLIGSTTAVNLVTVVKHLKRNGSSKKRCVTISCDDGFRHINRFYSPGQWQKEGFTFIDCDVSDVMNLTWVSL